MSLLAGRYRVGVSIGRGGTADVHRGFDHKLRRPVAIKLARASVATAERMLTEARTGAALSHPNVARVYDYGATIADHAGTRFLVMEYVAGDTLADRLGRTGPLPFTEAAAVGANIAAALAAAHRRGIVHRDVKPRNVILGRDGAKLVDFGVAARAGEVAIAADGRVWGTPLYMSPEQLHGDPARPPADVFALGVVLHECLTGVSPWRGSTMEDVLVNRQLKPVPTLARAADWPPGFVDLFDRCVAPIPSRRPSARELADELSYFAAGGRRSGRPPARRAGRRGPVVVACLGAVTAVLALLLAYATVTAGGEPGRQRPVVAATDAGETAT